MIFITENDVLKKGRALSHIDRTIREDNELWNDGNHIIYANAAYPDTTSDIGKLMHDFRCRNSEDMFLRPLRDSVHHFKETEGGRAEMSKDIERYGDERAAEAAIEATIKALRTVGQTDSQIESYLVKNYGLTKEDAEKYLEPVLV